MIKTVDKNADGKITREEAAGRQKWFDRLDQNADGVIDAAELEIVKKVTAREGAGGGVLHAECALGYAGAVGGGDDVAGILKPGEVGIGRMIADVPGHRPCGERGSRFENSQGRRHCDDQRQLSGEQALPAQFGETGEGFRRPGSGVAPGKPFTRPTVEDITAQVSDWIDVPYPPSEDKTLAVALQAATTTEVFLLDATRTVIYRGAIDDQYGSITAWMRPSTRYLRDAIAAFLAGERPEAPGRGCAGVRTRFRPTPRRSLKSPVTFHRDVARILQSHCVRCHRDGGIAPFALDDVEEVSDRAKVIKRRSPRSRHAALVRRC